MNQKHLLAAIPFFYLTTPANASLFTIQTTFTASSNVVQIGETVILDLTMTLIPDLAADAAANVNVFGTPIPGDITVTNGITTIPIHNISGPYSTPTLYLLPNMPIEYTFVLSYQTPGIYSPRFTSWGYISVEPIPFGSITHYDIGPQGSTSVQVVEGPGINTANVISVPGPILGTGWPALAFIGLFLWNRRRIQA